MKISFSEEELMDRPGKGGQHSKYIPYDGKFLVRVTKMDPNAATAKGDALLKMEFEEIGTGREAKEQVVLIQSMKWKIRMLFEACGYTKEMLMQPFDLSEAVGKVIILVRKKKGMRTTSQGKELEDYDFFFNRPTPEQVEEAGGHISAEADVPDFDKF